MNGSLKCAASVESMEVRTLFVCGLPMDVRSRELYLLFRGCQGYESSLLKLSCRGDKEWPIGFVSFTSRKYAQEAKSALQGVRMDPDLTVTLRLEFARSNTKVSRHSSWSLPLASHQPNVHKVAAAEMLHNYMPMQGLADSLAQSLLTAGMLPARDVVGSPPNSAYQGQAMFQAYHTIPYQEVSLLNASTLPRLLVNPSTNADSPVMSSNVTSNHTLLVSNLSCGVQESELRDVFASFPGFECMSVQNRNGYPIAYVDYSDFWHASRALLLLQGFEPLTSSGGRIHIEFAHEEAQGSQ